MTFPTRPHKNTLKDSVWSLLRPGGLNMTGELFPVAKACPGDKAERKTYSHGTKMGSVGTTRRQGSLKVL